MCAISSSNFTVWASINIDLKPKLLSMLVSVFRNLRSAKVLYSHQRNQDTIAITITIRCNRRAMPSYRVHYNTILPKFYNKNTTIIICYSFVASFVASISFVAFK